MKNKVLIFNYLNRSDLYSILWVFYYLQGILYASGSIVSKFILLLLILISFYHLSKVICLKDYPVFFKGIIPFLLLCIAYGIEAILFSEVFYFNGSTGMEVNQVSQIQAVLMSLLPFFSYYYYAINGYISGNKLAIWFFIFLLSTTLSFYFKQNELLNEMEGWVNVSDGVTNNVGYTFLSLLPGIVLLKNKPLLQFFAFAFAYYHIIIGLKRGAIVIGLICALYLFFIKLKENKNKKKQFFVYLMTFAILCVCYFFIEYMMNANDYFAYRINSTIEGNSSRRDELYSYFWQYFINQESTIKILFGNGQASTARIFYNFAHNDWLEILIDMGILGCAFYLFYWACIFKTIKSVKSLEAKTGLVLFGIIYFLRTFFSMSFNDIDFFACCFWSYFISNIDEKL